MKTFLFALLFWSATAWSADVPVSPQTALEAADVYRAPGPNFGFQLDVTYSRPDKEDQKFGFDVRVREQTNSLVRYIAPATDSGKKLLLMGPNMWIYIPGTRRAIRISAQQQLLGQVSNADVARVVFGLDYTAEAMDEVKLDQTDAYRLTLKAKEASSPFGRIELQVARADLRPLEAQFFALSGRLMKTVRYLEYQEVEGKPRPMVLEIRDEVKSGEQTVMRYSQLKVLDTPETWYQPDFLPRLD